MANPGDKFKEFINNKDAKGAVELMYTLYTERANAIASEKNGPEQEQQKQEILSFIENITKTGEGSKEIADENKEFFMAFMNELQRKYFETAIDLGEKRQEWVNRLTAGQVPGAELVRDEPDTVKSLARTIVLEKEPDSNVLPDMFNIFSDGIRNKTIGGKDALEFFENNSVQVREALAKEKNIQDVTLDTYVMELRDRDPDIELGFKVKPGAYKPGEDIFDDIPDYVKEIMGCTSPEDMDEYETDLYEKIHIQERHDIQAKSSVKVAKELLKQLDAMEGIEKTENYIYTRRFLEEYTHLGTDFVYKDDAIIQDVIKPMAGYDYPLVDQASGNVQYASEKLSDELMAKLGQIEDKNSPEYKQIQKQVKLIDNIYNLSTVMRNQNEEYKEQHLGAKEIRKIKKDISYINKARRDRKYLVTDDYSNRVNPNNFEKTLDEQIEVLSDSLCKDGVENKVYDNLINSLMEQKRLSYKHRVASNAGKREMAEVYSKQLEKNTEKIKNLTKSCREFEKTNTNKPDMTGDNIDRNQLLDRIETNLDHKINRENRNDLSYLWGVQKTFLDELWFAHTYGFKNNLKVKGSIFNEKDRERLGFNIDGDVSDEEIDRSSFYNREILSQCLKNDSIDDVREMVENVARMMVKAAVNTGKIYDEIYNSLEGQENQELKARYLFNYGGGRMEMGATDDINLNMADYINKFIDSDQFKNIVDIDDKNMTMKGMLKKLGLTEDEMNITFSDGKNPINPDDKVWEVLKNEGKVFDTRGTIKEYIYETLKSVWSKRGNKKAEADLSDTDKKYYNHFKVNIDNAEAVAKKSPYGPIQNWINETGENLKEDLHKVITVEKLNMTHAVLGKRRLMGVHPTSEVGRFYHNYLKQENTYIRGILKEGKSADEVIENIVSEKKYEKLINIIPKKSLEGFDAYISLHTAGRAGDTVEKQIDNLAEVMACYGMKKLGREYNVKKIRMEAEKMKKTYCLDTLKNDPDALREALRGENTARDMGARLKKNLYGVKPEDRDNYFKDMNELLNQMMDPSKRSKAYQKLYEAVRNAAELRDKDMSPAKKAEAIRNANIDIYDAVENYTKGKENVRRSEDGNIRFDNAIDALATVTRYVPGFAVRANRLINHVNDVRRKSNPNTDKLIDKARLTEKYGIENAKKNKENWERKQALKNKEAAKQQNIHNAL